MSFAVQTALAATPILLILALMLGARWTAARAGLAGLAIALLLAWTAFAPPPGLTLAQTSLGALAEAAFTAATILWILFAALCIHQLQLRTGGMDVLRRGLGSLSDDPRVVAVLVAWFFALFLEGAAGFGTPVALAAPFLVGFGFRPVEAVVLVLIGHAAGVSFGAVGTPILPQIAATDRSGLELAAAAGLYHSLLGWVLLVVLVVLVSRARGLPVRPFLPWTLLAAALFFAPYFVLSRWVGPELPTLGGALVGGLAFVVAWRLRLARSAVAAPVRIGAVIRAAAPYLAVVALILATRLVPPVNVAARGWEVSWSWHGRFAGTFPVLYHPGTLLFLGFLLGAAWQRASATQIRAAMGTALRQLAPVSVALVAMLGLARVMVHAGLIDALAVAAAGSVGSAWPLAAPWVGVLGTFITGSATASNILFTDFQRATAETLDLPVLVLVGAQAFGAAVGNIVCPHNLIAGCATVGIAGQEGAVLRRTLWVCALYALLGGLLAWLWA